MIKAVYVIRAREDLAPEEFHRYWLEVHGPKVREVAKLLRARRYVQSHTVTVPFFTELREGRGMAAPYEGITEVWWASPEDMQAAIADPAAAEAFAMLAEDEGTFIDVARSTSFLTEEHEIFDTTADPDGA